MYWMGSISAVVMSAYHGQGWKSWDRSLQFSLNKYGLVISGFSESRNSINVANLQH